MSNPHVELLEGARSVIQRNNNYVCLSIVITKNTLCGEKGISQERCDQLQKACDELLDWIQKSISPYGSVTAWLRNQPIKYKDLTPKNVRIYRLRWIDNMIEAWSKTP